MKFLLIASMSIAAYIFISFKCVYLFFIRQVTNMKLNLATTILSTLCIFSVGSSISHAAEASTEAQKALSFESDVREVEAEFPYSALLNKASSIKINYTESDKHIDCSVSILPKSKQNAEGLSQTDTAIDGSPRTASKNHFAVAPLRACLSKTEAHRLIARL
jgi:hypothetical protein